MADIADASARVGTVVGGKYALKSLLGTGGMGAVYEAENTWTRRPVALKLLHPEFANSREVVERFMQEAQLASQLRHPNIVDVLDMGQEQSDNSLFIVQELLHGNDLRTLLDASGRLDAPTAIDIVLPLMGALALAHRRGVVHRDIKPENIYLAHDESGEVVPKLIDFGISKIVTASRADARNLTQTGTLVGTPNYMSPEQARGDAQVDGQSDVWSLGVVLYEMLSGCVPFDAPNQNVLMVKIIMEHAPRIETVAPDVHPALAAIVHGALSNDRAGRFADMPAFIAAVLQSGLWGPELFERHRRSLAISAEITGHFQALVRASAQPTPTHVTPARVTPPSLAPPPMQQPEMATLPRITPPPMTDDEAYTTVTRPGEVAPPWGSAPSQTPVAWSPQETDARVPAGMPRWVIALAGAAALVLVTVAGVVWVQRREAVVASQPAPVQAATSSTSASTTAPVQTPVTPIAEPPPSSSEVLETPDAAAVERRQPSLVQRAPGLPVRRVSAPPTPRSPPVRSPAVRSPATQRTHNGTQNGAPILGL